MHIFQRTSPTIHIAHRQNTHKAVAEQKCSLVHTGALAKLDSEDNLVAICAARAQNSLRAQNARPQLETSCSTLSSYISILN